MTTETVLVSTDWDPESPITTTLAGAWSQNWIAGFEGNSTNKIQRTAFAGGNGVTQSLLKTASASVSKNTSGGGKSSGPVILPGGEYGFAPRFRLYHPETSTPAIFGSAIGYHDRWEDDGTYLSDYVRAVGHKSPAFFEDLGPTAWVSLYVSLAPYVATHYAYQRYVSASPPYDLGDGEVGRFVFLEVDSSGNVVGCYEADDAPWHYNGPTRITPDKIDGDKKYVRQIVETEESLAAKSDQIATDKSVRDYLTVSGDDGSTKLEELRALAAEAMMRRRAALCNCEIKYDEITQEFVNRDMAIIPQPFGGSNPARAGIVMIDPVSDLAHQLREMSADGEDTGKVINGGYLNITDETVNRSGPPGVKIIPGRWKSTRRR